MDNKKYICLYAKDCEKHSWRPDDIAKARCVVASKLLEENSNAVIVIGAECEDFCIGRSVRNLSESLKKYLVEILNCDKNRILINARGHNTATETIAIVEIIGNVKNSKIIAVSSWYHLPRIWLIWVFGYFKFVRCIPAFHFAERFSVIHEIFGIPKSIIEIVVRRLTLKIFKV